MNKQAGFTLVTAIFIVVILALLGGYMVSLSGVQRMTTVHALQGAKAYQAARAGIEWALTIVTASSTVGTPMAITGTPNVS